MAERYSELISTMLACLRNVAGDLRTLVFGVFSRELFGEVLFFFCSDRGGVFTDLMLVFCERDRWLGVILGLMKREG